jgi:hypothetical protein
VAATMLAVALIAHARWPSRPITCHPIVAGMLVQDCIWAAFYSHFSRNASRRRRCYESSRC